MGAVVAGFIIGFTFGGSLGLVVAMATDGMRRLATVDPGMVAFGIWAGFMISGGLLGALVCARRSGSGRKIQEPGRHHSEAHKVT